MQLRDNLTDAKANEIYLIDFGLVEKYKKEDGTHRK